MTINYSRNQYSNDDQYMLQKGQLCVFICWLDHEVHLNSVVYGLSDWPSQSHLLIEYMEAERP